MLLAIEGIAGSGKSTVRDRLLNRAPASGLEITHLGQFSWLSLATTRTIIALRNGRTPVTEPQAVDAIRRDLTLHCSHNLPVVPGTVIADRWLLSSACLLALLYGGPVRRYLRPLAAVPGSRPEVTLLLTTPPDLCRQRLHRRPTTRRFGEDPSLSDRLAGLYRHAAEEWSTLTGLPILLSDSTSESDLETLTASAVGHLKAVA